MRVLSIIIFILVFNSSNAQDQILDDSIDINGEKIAYKLISFGKYSKTKPLIAITCCENDLKRIENQIIECYEKFKIEYTEFYIIGINKNTDAKKKSNIIASFLKKIDETRIRDGLSTIQIPYVEYHDTDSKLVKYKYDYSSINETDKIPNLHRDVKVKQICFLISGTND